MVEYGGLLVLLSAVIAVLVAVGIPGRVATEVRSAVCTIFDQSGCGEGQQPQADGRPTTVPTQPGTGPVQSPAPPGETAGTSGTQTPEDLQAQIDAAEREAEQAERDAAAADREAADADRQGGSPADIAKELAVEASGLGDAKRCITEGDLAGCGWTALTFVPVAGWLGRGGKAAKAANKARKLMERFQALKKVGDAARRRAGALRERARLARERARRAQETLCPTNSFVAGTLVLLADGRRKPIEDVDIGDRVLAADPVTGRSGARSVTELIIGQGTKRLVAVTVDIAGPGEHRTATITATDRHPFWVTDERRWADAVDLGTGDRLSTAADGSPATVATTHAYTRVERVYNLTVADLHTYYVSVAGATPVLVHNYAAPCGIGNALRNWTSQRFQFGNQNFLLDKKGFTHILERHHPKYWDGSTKASQTFFDKNMSIQDVQDTIGSVLRQNRDTLISRGTRGSYQIQGSVGGKDYVLGVNNGRIGQFFPGRLP